MNSGFIAKQDSTLRILRMKVTPQYRISFLNDARVAASKKIYEAGIVFRIRMDARMAFREKQQHRETAIRESMFKRPEQSRPRGFHGSLHCANQSLSIAQGRAAALRVIGNQVVSNKVILLQWHHGLSYVNISALFSTKEQTLLQIITKAPLSVNRTEVGCPYACLIFG